MNWKDVAEAITKMHYWLAKPGSELQKLRRASVRFWTRVESAFNWVYEQIDPMKAQLQLVDLLAWERDIERLPTETEHMYRVRVKYALPFAIGAGQTAGWLDMFNKLGTQWITIEERISDQDFDIVVLQLLDSDLANKGELIDMICRKYGRTTRRYQYDTIASMPLIAPPTDFSMESEFVIAKTSQQL